MKQHDRTFAGVWIDHNHAEIITTPDASGNGEYGIREKVKAHEHGHHSTSNENSSNNAHREAMHKYYGNVAKHLQSFDDILIFGPGKAQEEFFNHLRQDKHFASKKLSIDSAGNLTENQKMAIVRDFFKPFVHNH